ncbi:tryptophan 2,3-dioxygenase family protein [Falsibacillus pallidus]|uniref:Tryptophan 2,3-dioxygenase n=1 Tax=Falsibacillus pallidus TaxID=493781 RepID=A0A370GGP5_9BACI|nr:tryptophan 2,3-dioxygenase family protein [Falsibacillus pallidus]RDI42309.1 tryptophan 2,3-dioxygenase [Falsibacillus pallidus]
MKEEKKSELTDYEKYIRTEELLSLQKEEEELCCEDELTFQMIHQIAELHFKLVIQYIHRADRFMRDDDLFVAVTQLRRVNMHMKQLPEVFNLVKVITPADYHTIRLYLGRGSGQDSPGFNRILQLGPTLWEPFEALLNNRMLTPLEVYKQPQKEHQLYDLMQELIQFDENFQSFRHHHIQLVRRMIGFDTQSLKGIPAKALERGVKFEFYPKLWKAISELTDFTGSSYNAQPLKE